MKQDPIGPSTPPSRLYKIVILTFCVSALLSSPVYCEDPGGKHDESQHNKSINATREAKPHHHSMNVHYFVCPNNKGNNCAELYRHGRNLTLYIKSLVKGDVTPVDVTPRGRTIDAHHSLYTNIGNNENGTFSGIHFYERTNAGKGTIEAQEVIHLSSRINGDNDDYGGHDEKPKGYSVARIPWHENWPVTLVSRRDVTYSGIGINERDVAYNNLDFVESSFLYNKNLDRTRTCGLQIERMNATVFVDDNTILGFEFKPTKDTLYQEEARGVGQSRLKYRQAGIDQLSALLDRVTSAVEGDEIFYGDHSRKINLTMRSKEELNNITGRDHWLDCSYQDAQDIDVAAWNGPRNIYPDLGVATKGRHRPPLF